MPGCRRHHLRNGSLAADLRLGGPFCSVPWACSVAVRSRGRSRDGPGAHLNPDRDGQADRNRRETISPRPGGSGQRPGPRRGSVAAALGVGTGQAARRWLARWQRRPGRWRRRGRGAARSHRRRPCPAPHWPQGRAGRGPAAAACRGAPRYPAQWPAASRPAPPARARPGTVTRPASSEYSSAEHSPAGGWPHRARHGHRGTVSNCDEVSVPLQWFCRLGDRTNNV